MDESVTAELVTKQRAWLVAVLAARQETPSELARRAALSPTTLTRFLNDPTYRHALSARTIGAIEKVIGVVTPQVPPPPPPPPLPGPLQPLQLDLEDIVGKASEAAE